MRSFREVQEEWEQRAPGLLEKDLFHFNTRVCLEYLCEAIGLQEGWSEADAKERFKALGIE